MQGCPVSWNFWKMPFHSLLEIAENNQEVLVESKVPNISYPEATLYSYLGCQNVTLKKVELGVVIIGFTFKFSPACREASITKNFIFYDIIFKERRIL